MKEKQYLIEYKSGDKSLVNRRKLVELISANIRNSENRFVYKNLYVFNDDMTFTLVVPVITYNDNGFSLDFSNQL